MRNITRFWVHSEHKLQTTTLDILSLCTEFHWIQRTRIKLKLLQIGQVHSEIKLEGWHIPQLLVPCCKQDKAIWKYGEKTDGNNFIVIPNGLVLMKLLFQRIKEQVVFSTTDASSSIIQYLVSLMGFPTCLNETNSRYSVVIEYLL